MIANSHSNHLVIGDQYVINRANNIIDVIIKGQWNVEKIFGFSVDLKSMIKRTGLESWKMVIDISKWQFSTRESPVLAASLMKELIRVGLEKTAYINKYDHEAPQRQDRKESIQPEADRYEYKFFYERADALNWIKRCRVER